MAMSFDAFFHGITQQESGGNYKAIGPMTRYGRAYGRYQVLETNIANWTRKYYGKSLTKYQFLNSRAAQDAVARGVLKSYVSRYGYRGAAAAWYGGPGSAGLHQSTRPQPGGPSFKKYVDGVMGYASRYSGGGGGSIPSGSTYSVKAVTPKLDKYEMAATYGLTWATINGNKELKALFNKAVSGGWDATLFTAKLKNTKWWRTTSDSARKFFMMRTGDPATYSQKWKANQFAINKIAAEVGLGAQINKKGQSSALLKKAITYKMRDGWSDARIKAYLGNYVTVHNGQMWGEAGEIFDQLQQLAYMNGQKYSSSWYQKYVKEIVAGRSTIENTKSKIQATAAAKYSAFADQIKAGQNAMDLAAPYINTVARLLEVPETDVDLFESHVANAMQGAHAGANFTLWQFENYVRADPRWRKTNNARESMFSVARQVAKDFGMAY